MPWSGGRMSNVEEGGRVNVVDVGAGAGEVADGIVDDFSVDDAVIVCVCRLWCGIRWRGDCADALRWGLVDMPRQPHYNLYFFPKRSD